MHPLYTKADALTREVYEAALAVHEYFGPGLLESIYVRCLEQALRNKGHKTAREHPVRIQYEGLAFDESLRVDLLVDDCLVVEAKAVDEPNVSLFKMQTLSYLKLLDLPLGLVVNFGGSTLKGRNVWRVILKGASSE